MAYRKYSIPYRERENRWVGPPYSLEPVCAIFIVFGVIPITHGIGRAPISNIKMTVGRDIQSLAKKIKL